MSPYAGHGKLLGVVVVGGKRRRAVFWQAGGSRRLLELDEARKGCVVECGVELGNASAGVRGPGLARAERELGVAGSTFCWRSVVVMVADGPGAARRKGLDQWSSLGGPVRTPWIWSWRAGGSCLGWLYVCCGALMLLHGREWRDLLYLPIRPNPAPPKQVPKKSTFWVPPDLPSDVSSCMNPVTRWVLRPVGPQGAAHGLGYIQVPQVSAPGLVLNRSVSPGDPTHYHQSRYPKSRLGARTCAESIGFSR